MLLTSLVVTRLYNFAGFLLFGISCYSSVCLDNMGGFMKLLGKVFGYLKVKKHYGIHY